jgi:O-antigen/teichoic acid export membrane protein
VAGAFTRLRALRQHRISRNASWVLSGQVLNTLLQAGYFVLLARLLGVKEYGVFAGAFAVVNLITPYSALGGGMLFMRYVTADRTKAAVYWGNSLLMTTAASLVLAVLLFFTGPVVTRLDNRLIFVLLVLANCLFSQIANLGSLVFQTFENMRWTAMLSSVTSLARLLVLLVMRVTLHHASALQWSAGVLIASGCAAGASMALVRAEIGPALFDRGLLQQRVSEGFGFSFAGTTQAAYNDLDKVMLSHYGLNRENGFYTLAYRVIDVATTPIASLDAAALPRFFRSGHAGTHKVVVLALKSAGASLLLGVVIAGAIRVLAPVIPHLVGQDFSGVLTALRWLCWIPLLRGMHRASGSALTGSGRQDLRTGAQVTVAVANLFLNIWWIPAFGWMGAAWSSLASDALLAVLNALLLWWCWRRGQREPAEALAESRAFS